MFKNMKIGLRLGLGFGAVVMLMLILGGFAISRLASMDDGQTLIIKDRWPKTVMANEMIANINAIALSLRNAILVDTPDGVQRELQRVAQTKEAINRHLRELVKTAALISSLFLAPSSNWE